MSVPHAPTPIAVFCAFAQPDVSSILNRRCLTVGGESARGWSGLADVMNAVPTSVLFSSHHAKTCGSLL